MTARPPPHVIHLTYDGILRPIGYSQVARPAIRLAARGIGHTIVSLERRVDLDDTTRVATVRQRLEAAGVKWRSATWHPGGGPGQYGRNVLEVAGLALASHRPRHRHVVVTRGFSVGLPTLLVHALARTPFVYDIRGFWVEQRLHTGGVPARSARLLRAIDRRLYDGACALVSLTDLAIDLLHAGTFGSWDRAKPAVCIPTCVDYDEFRPDVAPSPSSEAARFAERSRGRLVLGWVGSVNADYCLRESMQLFALVRARRPDALLLCLTSERDRMSDAARAAGVPEEAVAFASPQHDEIATWLPLVDWGLLLLVDEPVKSGSVPTKLGEFFASGVRPVHFGCNSEVGNLVRRAGSGYSLPDLSDDALARAAEVIARSVPDPALMLRAREALRAHFSLSSGVDRYEALFRSLEKY